VLFGGVFLVGFLVNLARWFVGLRPALSEPSPAPSAVRMTAGFLAFAVGSGVSVAAARRLLRRYRRKDVVTGAIVGFFYAAACVLTFGGARLHGMGGAILGVGVWGGVAWAVSSGLTEVSLTRR
jgi:hypothetical protein